MTCDVPAGSSEAATAERHPVEGHECAGPCRPRSIAVAILEVDPAKRQPPREPEVGGPGDGISKEWSAGRGGDQQGRRRQEHRGQQRKKLDRHGRR